jgi:hypothetical protein
LFFIPKPLGSNTSWQDICGLEGVAACHFLDNRMFQKAGVAAIKLGLIGQCAPILGIGVSCSAKNIFFDRKDKAIAASLAKTE